MQTFFIFVKCALGRAYDVAADLIDTVEGISEVYSVSGRFDLMIKVVLPKGDDIGHFVNDRIHAIGNITDTETVITFNAFT